MMKITRREAIRLGLVGTGTLISPFGLPDKAQAAAMSACEHPSLSGVQTTPFSPQIDRFKAPLKILQPLEPKLRKEAGTGTDYYEITMHKERVAVVFDEQEQPLNFAEFWTYNGSIPGPLIRQSYPVSPQFALTIY
jgi:spore coat protein A, manganese oxidase